MKITRSLALARIRHLEQQLAAFTQETPSRKRLRLERLEALTQLENAAKALQTAKEDMGNLKDIIDQRQGLLALRTPAEAAV